MTGVAEPCTSTQTQLNTPVESMVEKALKTKYNCIIHKKEAEVLVERVPGEVEVVFDRVKVRLVLMSA